MNAQLSPRRPQPATIQVHIERLILDGLPLTRGQGAVVRHSVEAELARLFEAGSLGEEWTAGAALASLRTDPIQFAPDASPQALGAQIAGAMHQRLGAPARPLPALTRPPGARHPC